MQIFDFWIRGFQVTLRDGRLYIQSPKDMFEMRFCSIAGMVHLGLWPWLEFGVSLGYVTSTERRAILFHVGFLTIGLSRRSDPARQAWLKMDE